MLKLALLLLPLAGTAAIWRWKNASPAAQRLIAATVIHATAAIAILGVAFSTSDHAGGWHLLLVNSVFLLTAWGFLLPGLFGQRHADEYRSVWPNLLLLLAALNGPGLASGPVPYYIALESALFAIWLCLGVGSIEAPDIRRSLVAFSLGTGLVLAGMLLLSPGADAPLRVKTGATLAGVGLAVCTGLAPTHGWLPAVVARLPLPAGLLVAVLVPCAGMVGWLRLLAAVAPGGLASDTLLLMRLFGLATMAAAAWELATRCRGKTFLAHAAIFHTGVMVFAVGLGGQGGLLHGTGRALVLTALFLVDSALGGGSGVWRKRPFAAAAWLGASLAWCASPPFPLFASVFAVTAQAFAAFVWLWGALFLILLFAGIVAFAAPSLAVLSGTAGEEGEDHPYPGSLWASFLALALAVGLGLGIPEWLRNMEPYF